MPSMVQEHRPAVSFQIFLFIENDMRKGISERVKDTQKEAKNKSCNNILHDTKEKAKTSTSHKFETVFCYVSTFR